MDFCSSGFLDGRYLREDHLMLLLPVITVIEFILWSCSVCSDFFSS